MKRERVTRHIAAGRRPRRTEPPLDGGASTVDRRLAAVGAQWTRTSWRGEKDEGRAAPDPT